VRTVLVIATGGEEGEIVVPELDTPENHVRLREIRDGELAGSVAILGVSDLERLGYRDSGMVDTPANANPECFHQADKEQALERVVTLVRRYKPQVLVTYDERGGYGHPDHIACHLATVAAFEAAGDPERFPEAGPPWSPQKLYYTAFPRQPLYKAWQLMREQGLPTPLDDPNFDVSRFTVEQEQVTTAVSVLPFIDHKRRAIDCHTTQIRKDGPFLTMPDEIARDVFGVEHYTRAASRVAIPEGELEDDLFAGLR
jgi:LmbE family N-acetylglucosaminyl deacetylase